MAIFTVSITGVTNPIEVYGGSSACDDYVNSLLSDAAKAYIALSTDDRKRALVGATRFIDLFDWQGTATGLAGGTPTTLQWPRSGITLGDGSVPDSVNVPTIVVTAAFELAALVAEDPDVISFTSDAANVQTVNAAGGTGVTFFEPGRAPTTLGALPLKINRMLGKYLATAGAGAADNGYSGNGGDQSALSASDDNVDADTGATLGPAQRTYPY